MNSLNFPNMFEVASTKVVTGKEASEVDVYLLLNSEKGEFKSDPFFGIRINRYKYDQNNYILKDILIDELYSQIKLFCPQLTIRREDIKIFQNGTEVRAQIKVINKEDFTTDMYDLVLFQDEERA